MINLDKIIKNAFLGKCTIDELFDSATFLIHDGDSKSIHKFLEIGHIPEVNKIIYKNDIKVEENPALINFSKINI